MKVEFLVPWQRFPAGAVVDTLADGMVTELVRRGLARATEGAPAPAGGEAGLPQPVEPPAALPPVKRGPGRPRKNA